MTTSFTNECSISSNDSDTCNTIQYGPISVRVYPKSIPTLETGRKSKHLILVGDEAIRREKRRERNREAAKRLKEKRQLIEEELNKKIHELENQHSNLKNYLQILNEKKQTLTYEVNNVLMNEIDQLLTDDNLDITSSSKQQYLNDLELFDETIDRIINN